MKTLKPNNPLATPPPPGPKKLLKKPFLCDVLAHPKYINFKKDLKMRDESSKMCKNTRAI